MSNIALQRAQARTIKADLDVRIKRLAEWLPETSLESCEQADSDEGKTERLCWHTGYLIALQDVCELLAAA